MNRLFYFAILLCGLFAISCDNVNVEISGRIVGTEGTMVYLEKNSTLEQVIIDSVKLDKNGNFKFELEEAPSTPSLYHIIHNGSKIPLLIKSGDKIEINAAGNIAYTYEVSGSKESALVKQFNSNYLAGATKLKALASQITEDTTPKQLEAINKEYVKIYTKTKQMQLRFINEHKDKIAAVYALYQRLPGDAYLFKGDSDIIYYKTVADAISKSYPNSPYLSILRSQIARMDAQLSLISQIKETNIPELNLPDMYGNKISLSSLEGKVVLLQFWSAAIGNSNAMNADLKEVYAKYKDKGFEIYQVAIDTSKATWINAVMGQSIPWISVCDLLGEQSPALLIYNVQALPYNYLIGQQGDIVGKQMNVQQIEEYLKNNL